MIGAMLVAAQDFFSVPKHKVELRSDKIEMPIAYRDATATTVFYAAAVDPAAKLCAGTGLSPVRLLSGVPLAITWFEYRSTTIGPYSELSVALLCRPNGKRTRLADAGFFVLHLPVTTEIARAGGVELFGYPKTLDEIEYKKTSGELEAVLVSGGRRALSARIPLRGGLTVPMPDLTTYSLLHGTLMRTRIATDCSGRISRARGTELVLEDRTHPIAWTLERLQPRPRWVLQVEPFRSLLPLPVPVAVGR
jgi:hypothetical protein